MEVNKQENIKIKKLHKSFQETVLFDDFSIEFAPGTISCILGPSGCGKTTLLNMIGGTESYSQGSITGTYKKEISYIFQEPRLLPWKNVLENLCFVLKEKYAQKEAHDIALEYLKMVDLFEFRSHYPRQLSGGMRQRVAIARAFAYPSDIILMDEPLQALDLKLKVNLMMAFHKLWEKDQRTVVFVTHHIDEALLLGEEIFLFSKNPVKIKKTLQINKQERDINSVYFSELKREIIEKMD